MTRIKSICGFHSFVVAVFLMLILLGCDKDHGMTERERTIQLLTNDNEKYWVFDGSQLDGKDIIPSSCDSSYVLLMKADFTWKEAYFKLICNPGENGDWSLNDENDVITISLFNPATESWTEKHFEIEELSEDYLAYQIAVNNRLKYVRLRNLDHQ